MLFKQSNDPAKPSMPSQGGIRKWNIVTAEAWREMPAHKKDEFEAKAAQKCKELEQGEIDPDLRDKYVP